MQVHGAYLALRASSFMRDIHVGSVHLEMRPNNGSRVSVMFTTLWEFQPDDYG